MNKEYKVIDYDLEDNQLMENDLNELGKKGWYVLKITDVIFCQKTDKRVLKVIYEK